MSDELKDILNNSNKDIDNQKLMDYLSKKLSDKDSHDLERMMADDEFMNDAVEGLEQFDNVKQVPLSVEQLNRELQKQIAKKKARRDKRKWKDQPWVYVVIVALLILIFICYSVLKENMRQPKTTPPKTVGQIEQLKR